jgi:hypothetical protein
MLYFTLPVTALDINWAAGGREYAAAGYMIQARGFSTTIGGIVNYLGNTVWIDTLAGTLSFIYEAA